MSPPNILNNNGVYGHNPFSPENLKNLSATNTYSKEKLTGCNGLLNLVIFRLPR
jgi:hypothetical protein